MKLTLELFVDDEYIKTFRLSLDENGDLFRGQFDLSRVACERSLLLKIHTAGVAAIDLLEAALALGETFEKRPARTGKEHDSAVESMVMGLLMMKKMAPEPKAVTPVQPAPQAPPDPAPVDRHPQPVEILMEKLFSRMEGMENNLLKKLEGIETRLAAIENVVLLK